MVEEQLVRRRVDDPRVLAAMRSVPREEFVAAAYRSRAYEDGPLPIEAAQAISQPYVVAWMAQALELTPEDVVLEVGSGSGYAAAVISRVAARVYGIERHKILVDLARRRLVALGCDKVRLRHGDGILGWPEHAPYDAILVSAGASEVPEALLQQLKIGGRLVLPVGDQQAEQDLVRIRRVAAEDFVPEHLGRVLFVPLVGSCD